MNEENADSESEPNIVGQSSLERLQRHALVLYGRWVAGANHAPQNDDYAATRTKYLSLAETEQIVREYAVYSDDNLFAVGGESETEVQQKLKDLMGALMDRVMSNILREGVSSGLLECFYDEKANDFTFDVTETGKEIAKKHFEHKERPAED
jgi:hypothetical protein